MASRREWGLPLFAKELQEQAARRRTYVLRAAYVAMFLFFAMTAIQQQVSTANPLNALGQGQAVLNSLVGFQFVGVFFLLPAIACDVLTVEKERNTLALLFLTRLGPWTIIIEKLLSRLFPMVMVLMCALPIMAFSYSLGGLGPFQLYCAEGYVLLAAFQTACIAVMCSSLSNSTTGAFVKTYLILMLLPVAGFVLTVVIAFVIESMAFLAPDLRMTFEWLFMMLRLDGRNNLYLLSPAAIYSSTMAMAAQPILPGMKPFSPIRSAILLSIPSLLSGVFCLFVARWALYRRAFTAPSNLLLKFFRALDGLFSWANKKLAFDVKLVSESTRLPDDDPIAWREVSKRSLGQFRYLVRIMIPMLFPVIFVGAMIASSSASDFRAGPFRNNNAGLSGLIFVLWLISLTLIIVTAASAIPLERTRQTWDVLRSTQLSGRDILQQKLRGVQRLQWVCSIPVLGAIGLQAWWRFQIETMHLPADEPSWPVYLHAFEYLVGAAGGVVLYSEFARWLSLWCGLWIRNSMRAIVASVLLLTFLCAGPYLLLLSLSTEHPLGTAYRDHASSVGLYLATISPAFFVEMNEIGKLRFLSSIPLMPAFMHLALIGGLTILLRRFLLNNSDRYLGRIGTPKRRMFGDYHASETPVMSNLEQHGNQIDVPGTEQLT